MPKSKQEKYSYQICVSGAAKGKSVEEGKELAFMAGKAIAGAGSMLMTGATTGLPNYAAQGAKEAGGLSIGLSPAASKVAHVKKYRLPTDCYDVILYSGLSYVGRDALLVGSSDAVVSIGGRIGTLHEFTIAMEMGKPIGFLMGAGGIGTEIKDILEIAKPLRDDAFVIFDDDPNKLVPRLIKELNRQNQEDIHIYNGKSKKSTKKT